MMTAVKRAGEAIANLVRSIENKCREKKFRSSLRDSLYFYPSVLLIILIGIRLDQPMRNAITDYLWHSVTVEIGNTGRFLQQRRGTVEYTFYSLIDASTLVAIAIIIAIAIYVLARIMCYKNVYPQSLPAFTAAVKVVFVFAAVFTVIYSASEFSPGPPGERPRVIIRGWSGIGGQPSVQEAVERRVYAIDSAVDTTRVIVTIGGALILPLEYYSKRRKERENEICVCKK